jgi:hypothetical protein
MKLVVAMLLSLLCVYGQIDNARTIGTTEVTITSGQDSQASATLEVTPAPIAICQVNITAGADGKPVFGTVAVGEDQLPVCFVVPGQFLAASAKFRASQAAIVTATEKQCLPPTPGPNGEMEAVACLPQNVQVQKQVPKYANDFDLFVKHFIESLVLPILRDFPPPEVAALKAAAKVYQDRIDAAQAAILAGATGRTQ